MLNEFLKVAYNTSVRDQEKQELDALLSKLPMAELHKLASGTPIAELYGHMDKQAWMDCTSPGETTWLDQFKGTPLFDQAIALEQQELQAEVANLQKSQEQRAARASEDTLYDQRDRLRVQKKLLSLELAKQQGGATGSTPGAPPAPPGEPAQGAGAPGPVPAEGVQDNSQGLGGGVAKVAFIVPAALGALAGASKARNHGHSAGEGAARGGIGAGGGALVGGVIGSLLGHAISDSTFGSSLGGRVGSGFGGGFGYAAMTHAISGNKAKNKKDMVASTPTEKVAFADNMGRALARQDFEKAAHAEMLSTTGVRAGATMAKMALGKTLGGAAGTAARFAMKNKALVGAGIGAAGGAIAGGPDHRLSGALGGAALGGALGHAGGQINTGRMIGGVGVGEAAKAYGAGMKSRIGSMASHLKGMVGGGGGTPPVAANAAQTIRPGSLSPKV